MFDTIFETNPSTGVVENVTLTQGIISIAVAFVIGLIISITYMKSNKTYSRNFANSLIIIPALISVVITLINGNQAASLATIGAFTLIRFRSIQGTSRDLAYILFSMTVGLSTGMGYLVFAVILAVIVCAVMFLLSYADYGVPSTEQKDLRITIPENLDYNDIFDDIFRKYTKSAELMRVKTTNLGSMYELQYHVVITDPATEKEMIDAIRTKNGNLNIILGKMNFNKEAL